MGPRRSRATIENEKEPPAGLPRPAAARERTPPATRLLGIDLAWSGRARSGVCALDRQGVVLAEDALEAAALPAWIRCWRGERSLLAIDGPLVVPPSSGAVRGVERTLASRYGRRGAGPYPGGAASLFQRGRAESPAMALVRAAGGAEVDPFAFAARHRAIEVFPAPTWLELFGGEPRVVYKRGPRAARVAGLMRLRERLAALAERRPGLRCGPVDAVAARWPAARTLRDWKGIEDIIDARLCAYAALLWDRTRSPTWVVTGPGETWAEGYVVIPQLVDKVLSRA